MTSYDRWINGESCCNAHNFLTISGECKTHDDACSCEHMLLEISNLHTDDGILQEEIDDLSGLVETKLDSSAYTPTDLSDYYTKEEVDALIPEVPSLSGYATEQWVNSQGFIKTVEPLKTINGESLIGEGNIVISGGSGTSIDAYTKAESDARFQPIGNYLTEHQPLKTINGYAISGTGNIEITASGGSVSVDSELSLISTNPVENSAITEALNAKLDSSAYTPTDLSDYYTKEEVNGLIPEVPSLSGYATEQWVLDKHYISGVDLSDYALKSEIPTVPTSNSAFTNDEHYITSGDTVFNNYALTANTYTKTEVDNKFWCGTQAQYNALQNKRNDVLYLIHE